jgi:hypothetical protein
MGQYCSIFFAIVLLVDMMLAKRGFFFAWLLRASRRMHVILKHPSVANRLSTMHAIGAEGTSSNEFELLKQYRKFISARLNTILRALVVEDQIHRIQKVRPPEVRNPRLITAWIG